VARRAEGKSWLARATDMEPEWAGSSESCGSMLVVVSRRSGSTRRRQAVVQLVR